jgi:hypothetical protein
VTSRACNETKRALIISVLMLILRDMLVLAAAGCVWAAASASPPSSREDTFLNVNCSGLRFPQALQAAVAQGLLNRGRAQPQVWLSDIGEGLSAAGQQHGAGFPGAKFIEWKTGHAGGPWYEPLSVSGMLTQGCQGSHRRPPCPLHDCIRRIPTHFLLNLHAGIHWNSPTFCPPG